MRECTLCANCKVMLYRWNPQGKVEEVESRFKNYTTKYESRAACEAVTNVAAIIPNRQEEIKRWDFSCKYSNLQLTMEKISAQEYVPRLRISRQCTYEGACDTKKKNIENFPFNMKLYFLVAKIVDEARKVTIPTMCLGRDVKLWWLQIMSIYKSTGFKYILKIFSKRRTKKRISWKM